MYAPILTQVSANISGAGGWEAALKKAQAFVGNLTLEEKARMVTGRSKLFLSPVRHRGWCATAP
jgi:hypothetical protein